MAAQISPDGKYYWDGQRWVALQPSADAQAGQPGFAMPAAQQPARQPVTKFSDDRQWWWNGTQWVPASQAPALAPAAPPAWAAPPAAGQLSRPMPAVASAVGLGYQFGGAAGWSIGFGIVSIAAPLFVNFIFPIMPVVGLLNAVRAFQRGRVAGAVVGVILNLIGGALSLIALTQR